MSALATSALSLSNSFTKVGAIAAFAALVGIALLSLLIFAQAREIKRLREWAGRAPERAAEREQRIAADAQRERGLVAHTGPAARVIPRSTPLVSAPVSSAVSSAAAVATSAGSVSATPATHAGQPLAAARPGGEAASQPQETGQQPQGAQAPSGQPHGAHAPSGEASVQVPSAQSPAAQLSPQSAAPVPPGRPQSDGLTAGQPQTAEHEQVDEPAASPETQPGAEAPAVEPRSQPPAENRQPAPESLAAQQPASGLVSGHPPASGPAIGHRPASGLAGSQQPAAGGDESPGAPVPATVAGAAVGGARGPFPPSPSVRRPEPAASAAAAAPVASRAVGQRAPASRRTSVAGERAEAGGRRSVELGRRNGQPEGPTKYYRRERSPRRGLALGVGGAVLLVVVAVLLFSALKGGSNQAGATYPPSSATSSEGAATNPAETSVTVLNGTSIPGLAHRLASELQQSGYTLAAASSGVPSGSSSHSSTVVEYAPGHRADARRVAKDLHVSRVQPLSPSVASFGGSAVVVVVAGSDKAPAGAEGATGSEAAAGAGAETASGGSAAAAGTTGAAGGEASGGEPTAP